MRICANHFSHSAISRRHRTILYRLETQRNRDPSAGLTFSNIIKLATPFGERVCSLRADCRARFKPDVMMKSSVPPSAPVTLPPLVAAYVEATNSFDIERLMATFAEDALVNDQLRDYWGKPTIREWASRDIIGERLTMFVTKVINHYGNFIVTANVDGNYDKRGMPDPLVLAFYLTAHSDLIVQLIILRNRYDI